MLLLWKHLWKRCWGLTWQSTFKYMELFFSSYVLHSWPTKLSHINTRTHIHTEHICIYAHTITYKCIFKHRHTHTHRYHTHSTYIHTNAYTHMHIHTDKHTTCTHIHTFPAYNPEEKWSPCLALPWKKILMNMNIFMNIQIITNNFLVTQVLSYWA